MNMHKYLPSKRFSYILLSLVVAFGIIYILSIINRPDGSDTDQINLEIKTKTQEFLALDSDNDGLKDWEEALYKTDPKKTDTDGDGTSDYEEIKAERDPLKANTAPQGQAPSDKTPAQIIAEAKKVEEDYGELTATDKVGRTLFSSFIANQQVGQPLSQTDINNIAQSALSQIPIPTFKQYTLTDLKISPDDGQTATQQYGSKVIKVIEEDYLNKKKSTDDYDLGGFVELEYILGVMSYTNDGEEVNKALQELSPIISNYNNLVAHLLTIPVPKILTPTHLSLINAIEAVADNLQQIESSNNDIILLLPLLSFYGNNIGNLFTTFSNTQKVFTKNQIIFSPINFGL